MKWKEIEVSECSTFFKYKGQRLFPKTFIETLKFHEEGLAAVCDETGWYHIDLSGKPIYEQRYTRTFGFYFGKSAVIDKSRWHHIDTEGNKCYFEDYSWVGNYQENLCTVRNFQNQYFHINGFGEEVYQERYRYAGDFKEGYAVVKMESGLSKHIDKKGNDLNGKLFYDLGVFHKSYATAKDERGWFHIDKSGNQRYPERYISVEPYYNGFSLVDNFQNETLIIDESGKAALVIYG